MSEFEYFGHLKLSEIPPHEIYNGGLLFQRFWPVLKPLPPSSSKDEKRKHEELKSRVYQQTFTKLNKLKSNIDLVAIAERTTQRVTAFGGDVAGYVCDGRFLAGSGLPHATEVGFLWHPTIGLPYLPGSSVKGLIRAAIELYYDGEDKEDLLIRWFGSCDKEDDNHIAGRFIFHDALPLTTPTLSADVMTPHMGNWYAKGGKSQNASALPGDWHSPTPIPHLIATKVELLFAIQPRAQEYAAELSNVFETLSYALENMGVGAKTAVGFGQFKPGGKTFEALKKQADEQRKMSQEADFKKSLSPHQLLMTELLERLNALRPADKKASSALFSPLLVDLETCFQLLRENNDESSFTKLKAALDEAKLEHSDKSRKKVKAWKLNEF